MTRTPFSVIIAEVAKDYGITVEDLASDVIRKDLHIARCAVAVRSRKETNLSFYQIGQRLGGRHHSTILNMTNPAVRQETAVPRDPMKPADFEVLAALDPIMAETMRSNYRARRIFTQHQLRLLFEAAREQVKNEKPSGPKP